MPENTSILGEVGSYCWQGQLIPCPPADKTASHTHHGIFKPEEVAVAVLFVPPDDAQVTLAEVLVRQVDHVPDLTDRTVMRRPSGDLH